MGVLAIVADVIGVGVVDVAGDKIAEVVLGFCERLKKEKQDMNKNIVISRGCGCELCPVALFVCVR